MIKRSKNKGVVVGQVFIYIVAIVVFAVVLIFGYQAITSFLDKGEKVAYITFKTDLENSIKDVYSNYGTVVIYNAKNPFSVPSKYERVCFVDLGYDGIKGDEGICTLGHKDHNPIACNAWESVETWEDGNQNVFLEPMGLSPIKVKKIKFENAGYLCLEVLQGKIFMRLEGFGGYVLISEESVNI